MHLETGRDEYSFGEGGEYAFGRQVGVSMHLGER